MERNHLTYMAFMLRLWLEDGPEFGCSGQAEGEWRASLENPHTQERQAFPNLEALFDYLSMATKQERVRPVGKARKRGK